MRGAQVRELEGLLLTAGAMAAHNTFDAPERVAPVAFAGARVRQDGLSLTLPPMSVVALTGTLA